LRSQLRDALDTYRQEILRKVQQWLSYADDDPRLAQHGLMLTDGCSYRLIAHYAQQCVEKHPTAYLVYQGVDFPYTDNISGLLELCADEAAWADTLQDAE